MEFVISKADLVRATLQAAQALHDDEKDMVLTHYLLEAKASDGEGATLVVCSTNRATTVVSEVPLRRIVEPGKCTLPGHIIHKLAIKAPDADIRITYDSSSGRVEVVGGPKDGINFVLQSLEPSDFGEAFRDYSRAESMRPDDSDKYLTAHFLNHVTRARKFVSEDDSKPAQMVMTLRGGNFLAGDGKIFHCASTNLNDMDVFSVPGPVTLQLVRWLKSITSEKLEFRCTESYFYVIPVSDPDKGYFGFVRQDVDWPNAENGLLPKFEEEAPELSVDKPSILGALERLSIVLPKGQVGVAFRLKSGVMQSTLTLATQDSRGNESTETLPCQWTGDDGVEHFFNVDQLVNILKLFTDPICKMKILGTLQMGVFIEDLPEGERLIMSLSRLPRLVEEKKVLDAGVDADGDATQKGKVTKKTAAQRQKEKKAAKAESAPKVDDDAADEVVSNL